MPPELTPTRLAEPAPRATRALAAERLAQVSAAYDRFVAGEPTGLHDLRVALRRLRSWLRAYRPEVDDTLRKKTRRRLNKLAKATNGARDAEVALEWIAAQSDITARDKPGARYIAERLEQEREAALQATHATLDSDLPKLVTSLAEELETYWLRRSVAEPDPVIRMSSVTRDVLVEHGERLVRALGRIESPADFEGIHRARIAAKRLRYLLETLNGDPAAVALVKRLSGLQDALGHSHDAHRITSRLVRELGECAARDARLSALRALEIGEDADGNVPFSKVRPGLTALAKRAHQSDRKAYDHIRRSWRKRDAQKALSAVEALAESLVSG